MKRAFLMAGVVLVVLFTSSILSAETTANSSRACLTSFFTNTLHYTGGGMRHWYEEEGGFLGTTKIPYDQLDCKSCHVKSCDQRHLAKKRAKSVFKTKKAKDINACLPCHIAGRV